MPLKVNQKTEIRRQKTEVKKPKARKRIIFLVGPTAVGKTAVAVKLAKKINAEIISCDSMQIYQGMDVISSKPGAILRKKIKHHLISVLPSSREYNVSKYRKEAIRCLQEIIGKGKAPVFCGGTGLYLSALVDGIFKGIPANAELRKKLYQQSKKYGRNYLYKKLKRVDSKAAEKIHPNDTRRVIRALEVFTDSGRPISGLQKERAGLSADYDLKIFCLNLEREALYQRINSRVDRMIKDGLLNEVKSLLARKLSATSRYAIGIKELDGYFKGKYGLEEAKELIKRNSRRYAKRQLTWFRKDKRIEWINIKDKETPARIARRLWKKLS